MSFFLFFLATSFLGTCVYVYFRREQERFVSPNKHSDPSVETFRRKQTWNKLTSSIGQRISLFAVSFVIARLLVLIIEILMAVNSLPFTSGGGDLPLTGLFCAIMPIWTLFYAIYSLPIFPFGLFSFFIPTPPAWLVYLTWGLYIGTAIVGIQVEDRHSFKRAYGVFLVLLILTIIGWGLKFAFQDTSTPLLMY